MKPLTELLILIMLDPNQPGDLRITAAKVLIDCLRGAKKWP